MERPEPLARLGSRGRRGLRDSPVAIYRPSGSPIFGFLAFRSEVNRNAIENNAHRQVVANYKQCQRSITNTTKINATDEAFIQFLSPFRDAATSPVQRANLDKLIDLYEHSKLTVPVCGAKP
jgi:hypothetical protein